MLVDVHAGPNTRALLDEGFRLSLQIDRLQPPETIDGKVYLTAPLLTATPARGKALRKYGRKGPAAAMHRSSVPLELYAAEKDQGGRALKDAAIERNASTIRTELLDKVTA